MLMYLALTILALALGGYVYGRRRAIAAVGGREHELHSRPSYHGAYVASYIGIPSFLLILIWIALQGPVIDTLLLWSLPASATEGLDKGQIGLLISQIKSVAAGNVFGEPTPAVLEAAERYQRWHDIVRYAMVAAALSVALAGLYFASSRIAPEFRARHGAERVLSALMMAC